MKGTFFPSMGDRLINLLRKTSDGLGKERLLVRVRAQEGKRKGKET